jgi:hypothetical protein
VGLRTFQTPGVLSKPPGSEGSWNEEPCKARIRTQLAYTAEIDAGALCNTTLKVVQRVQVRSREINMVGK